MSYIRGKLSPAPVLGLTVPVPSGPFTSSSMGGGGTDSSASGGIGGISSSSSSSGGLRGGSGDNDYTDEHGGLMQAHRTELARQDTALDAMSNALDRLSNLSRDIASEVTVQSTVIEEVTEEVDTANALVAATTKRVDDLVKKSGGCGWFSIIVALCVVVFILFLIVIFG